MAESSWSGAKIKIRDLRMRNLRCKMEMELRNLDEAKDSWLQELPLMCS